MLSCRENKQLSEDSNLRSSCQSRDENQIEPIYKSNKRLSKLEESKDYNFSSNEGCPRNSENYKIRIENYDGQRQRDPDVYNLNDRHLDPDYGDSRDHSFSESINSSKHIADIPEERVNLNQKHNASSSSQGWIVVKYI